MDKKVCRIDEDETVVAALREGRHADDIQLFDCPYCGVPSYYNQGSHFTCRVCERTFGVIDDDSGRNNDINLDDVYTLADYWETAVYPCDDKPVTPQRQPLPKETK